MKLKENDIIKIKESAIKIKENDIEDTIKSLDSQSIVSYYLISALLGFLALIFRNNGIENYIKIIILVFGFILVFIGFYNILAKKVNIHSNMSGVFKKSYKKNYEEYLNKRYSKLEKIYINAKEGLLEKSNINKCLTVLGALFILISLFNLIKII